MVAGRSGAPADIPGTPQQGTEGGATAPFFTFAEPSRARVGAIRPSGMFRVEFVHMFPLHGCRFLLRFLGLTLRKRSQDDPIRTRVFPCIGVTRALFPASASEASFFSFF